MLYDYLIIGGGIIGASTAWQLQQRYPAKKILLLEKENEFACHQTGHNSGVIHAGVYYKPGSLKAEFCKQGVTATVNFCKENHIPYQQCGKLLVATTPLELQHMQALAERCKENGIDIESLSETDLFKHEPNINGLGAIRVTATGIVDYRSICAKMIERFMQLGGKTKLDSEVIHIEENDKIVTVKTYDNEFQTNILISCAGLMADRIAVLHGLSIDFRIVPFRGEYYRLPATKNNLIKHLIYPVPDPKLPFLGVHLTRMIDGGITVGPNAVLGWKREGYDKVNFSVKDTIDMVNFSGFWHVVRNNLKYGFGEIKNSLWKRGYLRQVRKYCPQLNLDDLLPYPAGVRAQAVMADGSLAHDFLFAESPHSLHVCNAPSPAATSAIPIGHYICDKLIQKDKL